MKRIILSLLSVWILLFCSCGQAQQATWQDYYDLGIRYLSEGNYEKAIIAFTAATEIDPKQVADYEDRGNAYVGQASTLVPSSAATRAEVAQALPPSKIIILEFMRKRLETPHSLWYDFKKSLAIWKLQSNEGLPRTN